MLKKTSIQNTQSLGKAILKRRQQLGLKQADAAGLLGVGVRFLSELERGKETCELGKVLRVLIGLGLSLILETPNEIGPCEA